MKRSVLFLMLCLILAAGGRLAAQDYTIKRLVFIPSTYFVGDKVELRLGIRSDFADKMVLPQQLVQPAWGTIGEMRLVPGDGEVELRLQFISFAVGTRSLPAINLGPVVLEGINVYVSSLAAGGDGELAPLREPLLVPDLWPRLLAQVLILLSIPLGIILGTFLGWPRLRQVYRLRAETLPFRRFMKNLRLSKPGLDSLDSGECYDWLLGEVRNYLAARCRFPALAATSAELEAILRGRIHHGDTVTRLVEVFRHAERVKFAGEPASLQARHADVQVIEQAVGHIEHEERLRRGAEAADAPESVRQASALLGRRVREGRLRSWRVPRDRL